MADTEREKGGRCRWAWIGGQKNNQSQWQWTDNSTWTFTNWLKDRPLSSSFINAYMIMRCGGHWYDFPSYWDHYFLCQAGNIVLTENGLHRIALNEKQLAFSPYYVLFEASSASSNLSNFSNDSNSSAAADETSSYSGFTTTIGVNSSFISIWSRFLSLSPFFRFDSAIKVGNFDLLVGD